MTLDWRIFPEMENAGYNAYSVFQVKKKKWLFLSSKRPLWRSLVAFCRQNYYLILWITKHIVTCKDENVHLAYLHFNHMHFSRITHLCTLWHTSSGM